MDIGLMWFDNDRRADMQTRVQRAARYYHKKYGQRPNVCFVNPETGQEGRFDGVQVRTDATILTNHFWIGVEK